MSDLDNILDDALADFEKDGEENSKESTWESSVDLSKPPLDFNDFTQVTAEEEEKYIDDLTEEFDKAFTDFLDSTPDLKNSELGGESSCDIDENVAKTMEGLFRDAATGSPAEEGPDSMMPILESMLSKLLSKEVLHEPLRELRDLYPEWLESNAEHPKLQTYTNQFQIVQDICRIFEGDCQNEGRKVYALLNDMQETGPPPEDIVEKMSLDIPEPMKTPAHDQCCIQ